MRSLLVVVVVALGGCGAKPTPLAVAGSDKDDGHGELAQASTQFMTSEHEGLEAMPPGIGGATYGGAAYAGYVVPPWSVTPPARARSYRQLPNLTGAIEGTVALTPTPTPAPAPNCGAPRVALVYIEDVQTGRVLPTENRLPSTGGTLTKRGCTLAPAVQIVTPLPAALAIHGDAKPATVRISDKRFELQAAGRIALQLAAGETRVELEGGGTAWILAIETPYYTITDDRGRFRLDELAAGTYEVTVWQPPRPPLKRTVRVDAHRATRLDIR